MELSFEKNLWGQYDKLHERLIKKKNYYDNIHKMFGSIQNSFKNIMKILKQMNIIVDPVIFPKIQVSKDSNNDNKFYGFPLIMKIIKDYLSETIDFNNQTLENILNNIATLIKTMNKEKNNYEEYLKCLNSYSDSKKTMEQNMKVYFQKSKAAEQSVYDLKKLELKYTKINKDELITNNINKMKESSLNLIKDSMKYYKIYKDSVKKANDIREESIRMEKLLLYKYQNIEEETGKISTSLAFIFSYNQNIQKEIAEKKLKEMEDAKKTLNSNKDIKQLIIEYSGNCKPYEEHKIKYFESFLDFDKPENNEEYEIYLQTVLFIKNINKEEYPNFNKELEDEKNNMRNVTYNLFLKYNEEDAQKLKKYIKNNLTHKLFLIILSKLRTGNRYTLEEKLINLLGIVLNMILDDSEKAKNNDNAKNCIILSQTFCYFTEKKEKVYLIEKIRKHKWLNSPNFWEIFIDQMINLEIKKYLEMHPEVKIEDFEKISDNLGDKARMRLSEILFSQLLPYVNNMKEFKLDNAIILQITDKFCERYKALNEIHSESIYGLISDNKEEINKLREKYKKNKK